MAGTAGLHIGEDDGVLETWNGTLVSNVANLDVAVAPAANKHVLCVEEARKTWVGLASVAQVWNATAGTQVVSLASGAITAVHDITFCNDRGYAIASEPHGTGSPAFTTAIGGWNLDGSGTPGVVKSLTDFYGFCIKGVRKSTLIIGGLKPGSIATDTYPSVRFSTDAGVTWTDANFPAATQSSGIMDLFEHSDGYIYAVSVDKAPVVLRVYRTSDLSTWTLVHSQAGYNTGADSVNSRTYMNGAVTYVDSIIVPINPSPLVPANIEVLLYNGTVWSKVVVDAQNSIVYGLTRYTDGVSSSPKVWLGILGPAFDELWSYDGSTWGSEFVSATANGYVSLGGPTAPVAASGTWSGPNIGTRVEDDQLITVYANGADFGVVIEKDGVVDTSNWDIVYYRDPGTWELNVEATRTVGFGTAMAKYDMWVPDNAGNYYVKRFMFIGPKAAESTSPIHRGDRVIHLTDRRQYYVQRTKVVADVRSAFIVGSGTYSDTWVVVTSLQRASGSSVFGAIELSPGTPAATP